MTAPIIDAPGEYLTRNGTTVNIIAIGEGEIVAVGKINGRVFYWGTDGLAGQCIGENKLDIISKAPPPPPPEVRGWAWAHTNGFFLTEGTYEKPPEARRIYMIETDPPEGETP